MKRIIVVLTLVLVFLAGCKKYSIKTVEKIELGRKQYINQLEKININDTSDYIIITKKVKWEMPEYEEGTTINFSIAVPYTIIVDGKDYEGIYQLGDSEGNIKDNNPKYEFTITNLTKEGDIEVLIEKK